MWEGCGPAVPVPQQDCRAAEGGGADELRTSRASTMTGSLRHPFSFFGLRNSGRKALFVRWYYGDLVGDKGFAGFRASVKDELFLV